MRFPRAGLIRRCWTFPERVCRYCQKCTMPLVTATLNGIGMIPVSIKACFINTSFHQELFEKRNCLLAMIREYFLRMTATMRSWPEISLMPVVLFMIRLRAWRIADMLALDICSRCRCCYRPKQSGKVKALVSYQVTTLTEFQIRNTIHHC